MRVIQVQHAYHLLLFTMCLPWTASAVSNTETAVDLDDKSVTKSGSEQGVSLPIFHDPRVPRATTAGYTGQRHTNDVLYSPEEPTLSNHERHEASTQWTHTTLRRYVKRILEPAVAQKKSSSTDIFATSTSSIIKNTPTPATPVPNECSPTRNVLSPLATSRPRAIDILTSLRFKRQLRVLNVPKLLGESTLEKRRVPDTDNSSPLAWSEWLRQQVDDPKTHKLLHSDDLAYGDFKFSTSSSADIHRFENAPESFAVAGLNGCTSVLVVSKLGIYISHLFEVPSFKGSRMNPTNLQKFEEYPPRHPRTFENDVQKGLQWGATDKKPGTQDLLMHGLRHLVQPGQIFSPQTPSGQPNHIKLIIITPRVYGLNEIPWEYAEPTIESDPKRIRYPKEIFWIHRLFTDLFPGLVPTVIGYDMRLDHEIEENPHRGALGKVLVQYDPAEGDESASTQQASWRMFVMENQRRYNYNWAAEPNQIVDGTTPLPDCDSVTEDSVTEGGSADEPSPSGN